MRPSCRRISALKWISITGLGMRNLQP
jgi:hypothetical protein